MCFLSKKRYGSRIGANFAVSHAETLAEAIASFVEEDDFHVCESVCDSGLPDSRGLGTFLEVRK